LNILASVPLSLLFAFNLLPLPPLDGASAPLLFLSETDAGRHWNLIKAPGLAFFGMFVAWKLSDPVFVALHAIALKLLYPGLNYS
jgi:Zn-dependent protease